MGAYLLRNNKILLLIFFPFTVVLAQEKKIKSGDVKQEAISILTEASLPAIIIQSVSKKYKINGDTVSYPVSAYLKVDIKKIDDLFRQLEGFKVDDHGRVFFNGKEVTRILLDGEDLTGDQYQILSKNIQAGLIEKVNVYTHYSQNHILKGVEDTDNIAIDLRFREDKRNRLNGGIEAGYGMRNKFNLDFDAVGISKQFKLVGFFDKNNIGRISSANEFSSDREFNLHQSHSMNRVQSNPLAFPLDPLPEIGKRYTLSNSDQDISLVGSIKAGRFKTFKFQSVFSDLQKVNSGQKSMYYVFPDTERWFRKESYRFLQNQGGKDFRFIYKRDNERNRISDYEISGLSNNNYGQYVNERKGITADSLNEISSSEEKTFSLKGYETFKLSKGFVFHSTIWYVISDIDAYLNGFSSAPFLFPPYYLASSIQHYRSLKNDKIFTSSIYKTNGKFNIRIGIEFKDEEKKMSSYLDNKMEPNSNIKLDASATNFKINGSVAHYTSKKIFMKVDLAAGEGQIQFKDKLFQPKSIFNFSYHLSYQKSPFNRWGYELSIDKRMPITDNIFPSPLLGHNYTIEYGMSNPSFPIAKNIEINYQRTDFYRAIQFSSSIGATWIQNDNSISFFNYPGYTVKSYFIANNVIQFRNNIHLEKYFQSSKMKALIEGNGFFMKSPERINNIDTNQSVFNQEVNFIMVSNWKRFLNMEYGATVASTSVSGNSHEHGDKKTIGQFKAFLKLRATLGKSVQASFQFNSTAYKGINTFYAGSGSVDWSIKKSLKSSLLLHNMFNKGLFLNQQNDLYGSVSRLYFLQRRYVLFSLQWNF